MNTSSSSDNAFLCSGDWNNLPELGLEELDHEHREIGKLIKAMHSTLKSNGAHAEKRRAFLRILDESFGLLRAHFIEEERIMKDYSYPALLTHKKEHEFFLERIAYMQNEVTLGGRVSMVETLNFLGNLLHHHVLETDQPLVAHLAKTLSMKTKGGVPLESGRKLPMRIDAMFHSIAANT
jgi:hemerythrin